MTMDEHRKTLTKVQFRFVEEYLKDPSDGGEAYMKANGTTNKKSASVQASKLLKMDKVQDAMKDMAKSYLGVLEARIMQNVEFWLNIREGKVEGAGKGRLISLKEVLELVEDEALQKEIKKLQWYEVDTVRTTDKMKASEYLGKYMQMFIEKKEISGNVAVQIVDDIA